MGHLLGFPIAYISIKLNDVAHADFRAIPDQASPREALMNDLIITLAGPLAEGRAIKALAMDDVSFASNADSRSNDVFHLTRIMEQLGGPKELGSERRQKMHELIESVTVRIDALFEPNWSAITTLATQLLIHPVLSGALVADIVRQWHIGDLQARL